MRSNEEQGRREVSVFVSNIPERLDKYGLKGLFSKAGKVSDVYIPMGRRKGSGRRFGFVRFWNRYEALKSIQLLNNAAVRGCRLSVSLAKYAKGHNRPGEQIPKLGKRNGMHRVRQVWRKKRFLGGERDDQRMVAEKKGDDEDRQACRTIKGHVNEDFIPWLSRSLICTSEEPRDIGSLSSAIINGYGQCNKIYALSGFKFILTFQTKEEMEAALQNYQELDMWFTEIQAWNKYECCKTRKVWLEVVGVPPHGWKWETFKAIADRWGYLLSLGKSIARTDTFDNMRLLVETDILLFIEADFILIIEDMGFRVIVREISSVSHIVQQHHQSEAHREEDIESSQEVLVFEDIDGTPEPEMAMGSKDQAMLGGLQEDDPELVHYTNQPDSNFEKRKEESVCAIPARSINSETETKSVNFSHNACSLEVIKHYGFQTSLGHEGNGNVDRSNEGSLLEPPGFERNAKVYTGPTCDYEPIFNKGGQLEEVSATSDESTGNNQPGHTQSEKVSRANPKKTARKTGILRSANTSQRSKGTTENSLQQLANEAIEIGKILGVTLVQHMSTTKASDSKNARKNTISRVVEGKAKSRRQEGIKK